MQDERQEIQKKFDEELALLKAKYQKQYEPLYQSRLNTLMKKDGAADSEPVYGTPVRSSLACLSVVGLCMTLDSVVFRRACRTFGFAPSGIIDRSRI